MTGGTGGIYYPLAGGFGSIIARELPGTTATAEVTGGSIDNMKLIGAGNADIAFTALPVPEDRFVIREFATDPYVLVSARADAVTQVRDVTGRRLIGIPICAHEVLIGQHLAADGVVPAAHDRYEDNGLIQELVATRQGVAIVPWLIVDTADPRVSVVPLPALPPRRLAAVTRRGRRVSRSAV